MALPQLKDKQSSLFSEPQQYHSLDKWGYFSLLTGSKTGRKHQESFKLYQMPQVIELANKNIDSWISQAEFSKPNRRVVNLARIGLLFADIDCYKVEWAQGKTPAQLADGLRYFCQLEGIPEPSIIVFSGRGLQVKWLLDGVLPSHALPRWNACQRVLVDKLKPYGADPQARDASRVLRLVDTVNTKSGQTCRVEHVQNDIDGKPVRYGFEFLAETLLPLSRWEAEAAKQEIKEKAKLSLIPGSKTGQLKGFSGKTLAWHRLGDLRKLAELRGGAVQEGQRMLHLFWHINFLLLSGATNSTLMWHEARELARQIDKSWDYNQDELSTLYTKAKSHEKGESIEWRGHKYPALYTPKNATLIDLFQITDEEQAQLKTIISTDMAKARDATRKTVARRAAGAVERAEYLARSLSKAKPWEKLGMSRASWYRAGKPDA